MVTIHVPQRPYDVLSYNPYRNTPGSGTAVDDQTGNVLRLSRVRPHDLWEVSIAGRCSCGIIHTAEVGVAAISLMSASLKGAPEADSALTEMILGCDHMSAYPPAA